MTFYGRINVNPHHAYPQLDSLQLSHPLSCSISPIWLKHEYETISGNILVDIANRKYSYELHWSHMNVEEYNALETLVNQDNTHTFIYSRYPQAVSPGVTVHTSLSARKPKEFYGYQTYYSEITLILTEENSRL